MERLLVKFRYSIFIAVLIMFVVSYAGIYLPLKHELEESLQNNFLHEFEIAEVTFKNYVEKAVVGARSLTSRTMIRRKLLAYTNGEISFEQLRDYTRSKYNDGIRALENLKAAFRISSGKVVASYGESEQLTQPENKKITVSIEEDKMELIVYSPIKERDKTLGYDVLFFDLNPLFTELNYDDLNYSIETLAEIKKEGPGLEKLSWEKGKILKKNYDSYNMYAKNMCKNYYLLLTVPEEMLYSTLENFTTFLLPIYVVSSLLIIIFIYWTSVKASRTVIAKLEEKNLKLNELARKDHLTGLYNRYTFEEILEDEYQRAVRYNTSFSVIMFDLDDFKMINDIYGHDTGDRVLKEVSRVIKDNIRKTDYACRWGGEEFFIIAPETGKDEALNLAERMKTTVYHYNFQQGLTVSASFGVSTLNEEDNIKELLVRVDNALYRAKKEGKNRVVYK